MKIGFLLLALLLPGNFAFAQDNLAEVPIKTTLCAIKAHPENFQHKLVEFTAAASHGFEDSMVESKQCPWTGSGNPGVWMEFGGKRSTDTMYCCGLTPRSDRPEPFKLDEIEVTLLDDDLFQKFDAALHPAKPHPREECHCRSDSSRSILRTARKDSNEHA